jgi:hypothetical protein
MGPPGLGGPPGAPPPEAFEACSGHAAKDACTVKLADKEIKGTCDAPPTETRLVCRPEGAPPGPPPGWPAGPPPGR